MPKTSFRKNSHSTHKTVLVFNEKRYCNEKKCSKILMFILMIVSSIFFPSAYADEDDDKKSYIIIFKQAELVEN